MTDALRTLITANLVIIPYTLATIVRALNKIHQELGKMNEGKGER